MKTSKTTATCWLLMASISLIAIARSFAADLDTGRIDELTGLKGKMNEKEGVYKVTFPRDDVKVGRWMDNAAVHGSRDLGGIHKRRACRSDGDGRHRSL